MRRIPILAVACAAAASLPATARAEVAHTVAPGETLWSIAAANNLTTSSVAAYNGVSADHQVVLGSTVRVPTVAEGAAVSGAAPVASPSTGTATRPAPAPTPAAAPAPMGGYTVRPGDTLSGLAATAGVPTAQMAAMNGLDPAGVLVAGTVVKLPTGSPAPVRSAEPAPAPVVAAASPVPTASRVSSDTVRSIAAANGVPASLAAAIGYQESGFNNGMVSSANARGVMQVMPGTWDWVQRNLATTPLNAASADDNVRAGVLYLGHLLRQTGGDQARAVAGYYQGLGSVTSRGPFEDTNRYVANVQALQGRFGGP